MPVTSNHRSFLSGYSRWYPDGAITAPLANEAPEIDPDAPFLELLGPTNELVQRLEVFNIFNTNHLTIMSRLGWRDFKMLITGDAQMENWAVFDHERLMEDTCQVLRAAHHGSPNGTQWERIDRLEPSLVVVSTDPWSEHRFPDLISTAIFAKFDSEDEHRVVITHNTGTIHLMVDELGNRTLRCCGEDSSSEVDFGKFTVFDEQIHSTDWADLINDRVANL